MHRIPISLALLLAIASCATLAAQREPTPETLDQAIAALGTNQHSRSIELLRAYPAVAVPRLFDTIAATPLRERSTKCQALIELGEAAIPAWCATIGSGPTARRVAAIRATEHFNDEREAPEQLLEALVAATTADDAEVASMSAYSMFRHGMALVPLLEARLHSADRDARIRAAILLGANISSSVVPWPARWAGTFDSNSYYRFLAFGQLKSELRDDDELWRRALNDRHRQVRDLAVAYATHFAEAFSRRVPDLIAFLQAKPSAEWSVDSSEEWTLHGSLIRRLSKVGRDALPVLRVALERELPGEPNGNAACEDFHVEALKQVAAIGADAAPLRDAVELHLNRWRVSPAIRAAALHALNALPIAKPGVHLDRMRDAIAAARRIDDPDLRSRLLASACIGLGKLGSEAHRALEEIRQIARGELACGAACAALRRIVPDERATHEATARVLHEVSPTETTYHASLCAALDPRSADALASVEALLLLLEHPDGSARVRQAAIEAAARIAGANRDRNPSLAKRVAETALRYRTDRWISIAARRAVVVAWPQLALDDLATLRRSYGSLVGPLADIAPQLLVARLEDDDERIRACATDVLCRSRREGAVAPLLALAAREGVRDPRAVCNCIAANVPGPAGVEAITKFWGPKTDFYIIPRLQNYGADAVDVLSGRLSLSNCELMSHAVFHIGAAATPMVPKFVDLLQQLEQSKDREKPKDYDRKRLAILRALAYVGAVGQRALGTLSIPADLHLQALQDAASSSPDESIRGRAVQELLARDHRIPGMSKRGMRRERRGDPDDSTSAAQRIVSWIQLDPAPDEPMKMLLHALSMPQPEVRLLAVRELSPHISEHHRRDGYLRLLEEDPSKAVREAAKAVYAP